ncbi:MAG: hypothetical protein GVX78_04955 [Bacteroidetes bacterium]|nr:hypothetical protein [Bacteroidota bacterium]
MTFNFAFNEDTIYLINTSAIPSKKSFLGDRKGHVPLWMPDNAIFSKAGGYNVRGCPRQRCGRSRAVARESDPLTPWWGGPIRQLAEEPGT